MAPVPRLGRDRWLPRARHGPRQDPDDARAPPRRRRRRPDVGDRTGRRRRQLGGGGRALHAGAARDHPPRREPRRRRRDLERSGASRRRDHHLRHHGSRRRRDRRGRVVTGDPRRGPGDQERGEHHRPAVATDPRPNADRAHGHADRERARRPVGDPRLHEPRSRRTASAVRRAALPRRRDGTRGRGRLAPRSTESSSSGAPRPSRPSRRSCPTGSTSWTTAR